MSTVEGAQLRSPANREVRWARATLISLVVTTLSGVVTHLYRGAAAPWEQITYLLHTGFGVLLCLHLLWFLSNHLRRVLGLRRMLKKFGGSLLLLTLLYLGGSGLWFLFAGQSEALRPLYETHVWLGYGAALLFVAHTLLLPGSKPGQRSPLWQATLEAVGPTVLWSAGSAAAVLVLSVTYQWRDSPYRDQAAVADYQYRYGEQPFWPSQTAVADATFLDPRRVGNSESCRGCHGELFGQWQASVHSQAAADPTYVKNVTLLNDKEGIAATRYCEGCHAPVALLSGELSPGGRHGGIEGTLANSEGVSCVSCHSVRRAVHLKGVASYEFAPQVSYLFEGESGRLAMLLSNFLLRLHPQEHRRALAPALSAEPELCATCHEQFMDKDMNDWGWVKMQSEYSDWVNGPYSGRGNHEFSNTQRLGCKDCHMPLVAGNDPSANRFGQVVDHRTVAANTVLPLLSGDTEQLQRTTDFLRRNKVRVSIDKPSRADAVQSLHFVDRGLRPPSETPFFAYLEEHTSLQVSVENVGVGHQFPGGTTDINQVWLYFRVADAEDHTIFESGAIGADGSVDPEAHFYRTVPVDRVGREVWKHDLFRVTGDSYKKVIPAGGADVVDYGWQVPPWAKGPLSVVVVLKYRKLNERYARWALGDSYRPIPVVDMAQTALSIPLQPRPSAEGIDVGTSAPPRPGPGG